MALEDEKFQQARKLLFCDTDLRVIHVWSQHKFGKVHDWVTQEIGRRAYDLILLTDIDLPWEPDPQREHPEPEMRQFFMDWYEHLAIESKFPWEKINGDPKTRLNRAIELIESL